MTRNSPDDDSDESNGETTSVETATRVDSLETAAASSTYKVLGEIDAPTGTGVQGKNTATSGAAHGVEGVTASTDADASGVFGEATGSDGTTFGVTGLTQSSSDSAAGIRADAPNGGVGIRSTADGNLAIEAESTGYNAIKAVTDTENYNAIWAKNTASDDWSWGVRGETESKHENAFGVRGEANSTSGSPKGVGGTTAGTADGAAGVHGVAESTNGAVYGVSGETASTGNTAAGVLGKSPGSGANGVMGLANVDTPTERADEAGVYGETSNYSAYGVFGLNSSTKGTYAEGVYGRTSSPDSAAITGENSADGIGVKSDGALDVVGHADVSKVGMSAYLSESQTISNATTTTVLFDSTNADHFNGYDSSTGKYTIQQDGDYHVSFTIDWQTNFDAGVHIDYELQINESTTGGIQADTETATSNQRVCRCFSRTLFGLSKGETLRVAVSQDSGDTADLYGSGQETYLTIHKVG